jgi:DNA mismatch endonuclease (patch repair protein)
MSLSNKPRTYLRDGRAPIPANENISRSMRGNKATNTKPELTLRKKLWSEGLLGYRVNVKNLPGRPDIVFPPKKIAIFIHGCFWHRCTKCAPSQPKSNTEFWQKKFSANIARDERKRTELNFLGFKVITIWECELKNGLSQVVEGIRKELGYGS